MTSERNIYITTQDKERLERLLVTSQGSANAASLAEELDRAIVVPSDKVPPTVVTMNSRVHFKDEVTGQESDVTLVYPRDANVDQGRVSVLAPVGAALLGLSVGQTIEWKMPTGKMRKLTIVSIIYQPEAAGDFDR